MPKHSYSFANCKTKEEVINCYVNNIKFLEQIAIDKYEIEPSEFYEFFYNEIYCRDSEESQPHTKCNNMINYVQHEMKFFFKKFFVKRYAIYIAILAIVYCLIQNNLQITRIFMSNMQPFIYPVMRLWRKITLPIIRTFPELTELYDETCLVPNPFFRVVDLNCSPCANVVNVVDLSMSKNLENFDNSIPYIIKQVYNEKQRTTPSIAQLYLLYRKNQDLFRENAYKIKSTDKNIRNLDEMFDMLLNKTKKYAKSSHNLWRINRMSPSRVLRKMFPAPETLPTHAAIGIERYIAIDTGDDITYQLPSSDCSNIFVYQAVGSRTIHLQPTVECEEQCRRVSVRLKPNSTLFYDWWYWKPISVAADEFPETKSISYIGSYC